MDKLKVLGISGSLRKNSYNKKLLNIALEKLKDLNCETDILDLKSLNLPMFDDDIPENELPETIHEMRKKIKESDVLIISSPEYNYSVPGALKNAIDWSSKPRNVFAGKTGAIMGASSGPFGTVRMQPHLRLILTALDVILVPQPQIMVRNAEEAFNESGELIDKKLVAQIESLMKKTIVLAELLKKK